MSFLIKLKKLILSVLFPPICAHCQNTLKIEEKEGGICEKCLGIICIHTSLFCRQCRGRLPYGKKACHKNTPYLIGATTQFDGAARTIIHYLKYHSWSRLEIPLQKIMGIYFDNLQLKEINGPFFKNCSVIAVPLHKDRKRKRGFNQAEIIAKICGDYFNLPVENLLSREKETKSQTDMKNWDRRKENLDKAFSVKNPGSVKGKNIILVDDVFTSGATMDEAAKTLRAAGARKIIALVFARAG